MHEDKVNDDKVMRVINYALKATMEKKSNGRRT
jgi:hypothetical protein